jgi:hypothetical protein
MKVQTVIRKGSEHPVFCEDFVSTEDTGRYFVGAVFDGCSGGNDSHFASSLFGKIFKQILGEGAMAGNSIENKAKDFMRKFVINLFKAKVALGLLDKDMLATFMMIVYDKVHGECLIMTIGDGIICHDGEFTILENDRFKVVEPVRYRDMPNYIAYDIVDLGLLPSGFDTWFERFVTLSRHDNPKDISIATDGLLTFNTPIAVVDKEGVKHEVVDPLEFLLVDQNWMNNKIMLSKKVNVLSSAHKTIHKDDISIVRLIIPNFEEDDNSSSQEG